MDKFELEKKSSDYIILSDFDGTISIQDTNNEIFEKYGDQYSYIIEDELKKNLICDREALKQHYSRLDLNKQEFLTFIENNINLDPYFKIFYRNIKNRDLNFAIVSGGFLEYIKLTLKKEGINYKDKIYANRLDFDGNDVSPIFLHDVTKCNEVFGPCGNCKYKILKKYSHKKIIYIGDGLTDRCVATDSDYLLVKKDSILQNYCDKNKIEYQIFTSFKDVDAIFEKIID